MEFESVLLPVGLRLNEHHFFSQAVRRIGFLGIACPNVIFLKGDRRELRVGAMVPMATNLLRPR